MSKYVEEAEGFKVGNYVKVVNKSVNYPYDIGLVFKIDKIKDIRRTSLRGRGYTYILFPKDKSGVYIKDVRKCVVANNLNRKLYPNYVQEGEYLIPKIDE